jgi:hypothetical protein
LPSGFSDCQRLVDVPWKFPAGLGEVGATSATSSDHFGYGSDPLSSTVSLVDKGLAQSSEQSDFVLFVGCKQNRHGLG